MEFIDPVKGHLFGITFEFDNNYGEMIKIIIDNELCYCGPPNEDVMIEAIWNRLQHEIHQLRLKFRERQRKQCP